MKVRIVGKDFGDLRRPLDEVSESEDGVLTIIRRLRTRYSGWMARVPARGHVHPDYPFAMLVERKAKQIPPMLADVELTYRSPKLTLKFPDANDPGNEDDNTDDPGKNNPNVLPEDQFEQTASKEEIPIEMHPRYAGVSIDDLKRIRDVLDGRVSIAESGINNQSALELLDFKMRGQNSVVVGSVTEAITKFSFGRPRGVEDVIGTLSENGRLLTISGAVRQQGAYWTRTLIKQRSKVAWPSEFYT